MYDIIGDIHGHASILEKLLKKLGYSKQESTYSHPERKVLFVGDYIDRGPEVRRTLKMVRSMVDSGNAVALMGNHEFNAIMFNEPDGKGGYLRPRTKKNKNQHRHTLEDFVGRKAEYNSYINWFKKLPVYFEHHNFRAIHACWEHSLIDELQAYLTGSCALKPEYFPDAGVRNTQLYNLLDTLLKGKEVKLPNGLSFKDKDGHERRDVRIRWWLDPSDSTFEEWSFAKGIDGLDDHPIDGRYSSRYFYPKHDRPVFFGHYWLNGQPVLQRANVCCLDYSIGKKEKLVAYRFSGEDELMESSLEWVGYD